MTVENSPKEKENYVISGILICTDVGKNTRMHIMHNSRGKIYPGKNSRAQPANKGLLIIMKHIHRESKKGATLTMAMTLSILGVFAKFFHCCKAVNFQQN